MKKILLNEELKKLIHDVGEIGSYLWQRGWAERNAGNISVDITDMVEKRGQVFDAYQKVEREIPEPVCGGRCFLMTSAGSRMHELKDYPEEKMIMFYIPDELDGYHILWGGQGAGLNPTTEFVSHLKLHSFLFENNSEQKVVVHTHPHHLIALTHIELYNQEEAINRLLWSIHPELKMFLPEGVGYAPYRCPGTDELAKVTITALKKHRLVLWEKHGCLATGIDIFDAFDMVDMVNKAAQIFLLCRCAGYEVQGLSENQIKELKDRFLAT
ncbi:MAG: rhamnulose-1-phosphate aldolase [bacterium]